MKSIKQHRLIRTVLTGSFIFYALSGLASFLNYAYYPVISHLVDTTTYGEVQFLISLLTQLSIGYVVLNLLSIIITARYESEHERSKALQSLNTTAMSVIVVIIVAGSLILSSERNSFGFGSLTPIIMLGLSLLANIPFTIAIGRLQGERKFALSGIVAASASFCELVLSAILVALGLGTSGAIAGVGGGMLVALLLATIVDRRAKTSAAKSPTSSRSGSLNTRISTLAASYAKQIKYLRHERNLAVASLVAISLLTILSTADVLISKLLLSPHDAGQYAAVATISKTILYATTPLMWLSLPLALSSSAETQAKVGYYKKLTLLIGLVIGLVISIDPRVLTHGLLGINAGYYTHLLPLAALGMFLFSFAFIQIAVSICRDQLWATVTACVTAAATFGISFALYKHRGTMIAALISQIISAFIAIICSLLGDRIHERHR